MVKWNKLLKLIPSQIQISPYTKYRVLWTDNFPKDHRQEGETNFDLKQIVIRHGQSPRETLGTYLHECLHAFSDEYDINLTETQVQKLEKSIYYWLKKNNIFNKNSSMAQKRRKKR
jgi:hypothetical protein